MSKLLLAPPEGLEPPTLTLEPSCSIQLSYGGKIWGDRAGSNRQPPVPQTGALPIELRSPYITLLDGYFSAEKFRDPASPPSWLRLSSPFSVATSNYFVIVWRLRRDSVTDIFLLKNSATPPRHRRGSGFRVLLASPPPITS